MSFRESERGIRGWWGRYYINKVYFCKRLRVKVKGYYLIYNKFFIYLCEKVIWRLFEYVNLVKFFV